ncbi:hypothetical protein IFM89_005070 [Coptis chinensis]|uniref:Uncharacterized protein n=1 Tax=Coptis chinensis TaxID=261450 RepID=A0A835HJS0_9MAGN|nr:hypothetical protein IFM89_005070 [Coptis chinensis]
MLTYRKASARQNAAEKPPFFLPSWTTIYAINTFIVVWVLVVGFGFGFAGADLGWGTSEDFEFVDPPATVDNISTRALSGHPSPDLSSLLDLAILTYIFGSLVRRKLLRTMVCYLLPMSLHHMHSHQYKHYRLTIVDIDSSLLLHMAPYALGNLRLAEDLMSAQQIITLL